VVFFGRVCFQNILCPRSRCAVIARLRVTRWNPPLLFRLFCSSIFWLSQRSLSERELLFVVLGLSFYPLEQAPNRVIYAMSKLGTATSGLIYLFGSLPKPRDKRAPLLPKHSSAD
jgi:hypothetical protein